jgi:hypothetical protein
MSKRVKAAAHGAGYEVADGSKLPWRRVRAPER